MTQGNLSARQWFGARAVKKALQPTLGRMIMKSLLKSSVGALALLTGAGIAFAQQDSGAAGSQMMASDITCSQLVELDSDEAERAVYFLAGFHAAEQEGAGSSSAAASGMG